MSKTCHHKIFPRFIHKGRGRHSSSLTLASITLFTLVTGMTQWKSYYMVGPLGCFSSRHINLCKTVPNRAADNQPKLLVKVICVAMDLRFRNLKRLYFCLVQCFVIIRREEETVFFLRSLNTAALSLR